MCCLVSGSLCNGTCDGEESGQAAAQTVEWHASAWNRLAHDALASVCFCLGRAWPYQEDMNVTLEMTSFKSQRRMRARPAGGVAEDTSTYAMAAGLAFLIVYPPACGRARPAECPWHFHDEPQDNI